MNSAASIAEPLTKSRAARFRTTALLAAIVAGALVSSACKPREKEVVAILPSRMTLETVAAAAKPIAETLPVTGTLEATTVNDVAANATGKVIAVFGERGDAIKKGTVLARLDVRLVGLQAAVADAQAKAAVDQAESQAQECDRLEKLAAAGAIPAAQSQTQSWQCRIAKSTMAASQLQASIAAQYVTDGTIRAPIDGHLVERFIEVGQTVGPTSKVATIVSIEQLRLRISIPEVHLGELQEGAPVTFRVASYGTRVFSGTIARVSPVVRPETRDILAEAIVKNDDHALRPGMFATVDLPVGLKDTPVVPPSAVIVRDGSSRVFVVRDSRVEERAVQLGPKVGDEVAVFEGVAPDERVVRNPGPDVKNGTLAK